MRTGARANQGGSIVSFVVVGGLLLAGLGGGVYYLSRDGDTVPAMEQIAENEDNSQVAQESGPAGDEVADPDEPTTSEGDSEGPGALSLDEGEETTETEEATEPSEGQADSSTEGDEVATTAPNEDEDGAAPEEMAATGAGSGSAPTQGQLPQSGPAEVAIGAVALASIAFVVTMFNRSRRDLSKEINDA